MKGKHDMMMMSDMFYYGFHARCISMYMSLNGKELMYIVTAKLHRMIYVVFHVRHINIHLSLNRIKDMYIITTGLHMIIYKASCLDMHICVSRRIGKLAYEYS